MAKDIEVEIFLDGGKKFKSEVKGIDKGIKNIDKSFSKASKSLIVFNQGFQLLGSVIRVASRTVTALVDIGSASLQAASDFEEAEQKFSVVFSNLAGSSTAAREELVKDFGLSRLAATELLASTGDLLSGFKFSQKASLDLSVQVNKLAVDLASFSNLQGGAARASEILTKALLGEKDSLVALGVKILDSDVQNRLLENGQNKLTGSALRQAKAQATLALIYEQSKNAIGDFQRSSQSLANQQRILEGKINDLQVTIGQLLIPVTQAFIKEAVIVVDQMAAWADANKNVFASDIVETAKSFSSVLTTIGEATLFITKSLLGLKATLGLVNAVFSAFGALTLKVFQLIIDANSIAVELLVQLWQKGIQLIGKFWIDFIETTTKLLIDNPLTDLILSDVELALLKVKLDVVKKGIQEATDIASTGGENPISKILDVVSDSIGDNILALRLRTKAALDGVDADADAIRALDVLSDKLGSVNDSIQKNLDLTKAQADAGALFDEGENLVDKANTDAVEAESFEQLQAQKKLALQAFKDFQSQTEQARIDEVAARSALEIEGLIAFLEEKGEILSIDDQRLIDIARTREEEIFSIQKEFREKTISEEERDRQAKLQAELRQRNQLIRAHASLLGGLASLTASEGEKNFKITQGLRIGEAIVNTWAAANQTMASLPYPANIIATAGVVAQGLGNVNTIRSQQPRRAQQGLDVLGNSEEMVKVHFGETILNRFETSQLRDLLDNNELDGESRGGGRNININLNVENLQLLSDDDEAIGNLVTAMKRSIEEQNIAGFN